MKLTITLTGKETVEAVVAFGVISLLTPTLNVKAGFVKYDKTRTPQMFDETECSFRTDELGIEKVLTENKIKESDVIHTAFEMLFGFEYGSIDRIRCGEMKVHMRDGKTVYAIDEIENFIGSKITDEDIEFSELTIELGTICE